MAGTVTISWKVQHLATAQTQAVVEEEVIEEVVSEPEDLTGLTLVERARRFWGKKQ